VADKPQILVLGVGNLLLKDEGVGIKVVENLLENFNFSDNVELMDGGTLGLRLTDYITQCDRLIVVDAVLGPGEPGTLYRLVDDDLKLSLSFKNSMHDLDLLETLACCDIIGHRPEAVVVGIEPDEYKQGMGVELTKTVAAKVPEMTAMVLDEIVAAGGEYKEKAAAGQGPGGEGHVFGDSL
jgi:hydrogenase maturation protease